MSFFFWLDFVSTVSMLPDIGWVWQAWTGGGGSGSAGNAAQLAKTSRAGRVTRVIRVIRLIRLIRIVKLYKQAKLAQQKQEEKQKADADKKKKRESVVKHPIARKQTISSQDGKKGDDGQSKNNISGERFRTIVHDKDEGNRNTKVLPII